MTPEEAAEEILGGQPYTNCRRCDGSGWTTKPTRNYAIGFRDYCDSCQGSGQWLRGDYVAACIIVGKDPPPKPITHALLKGWQSKEWKEKLGEFDRRAPFNQFLEEQTKFRREYMGTWEIAEDRNDLVDAVKYSMNDRKVPKSFKL